MGRAHSLSPASTNKRHLAIVFGLTSLYLIAEVIGGLLTGSLALLADAGHMLTDVAGLGLALHRIGRTHRVCERRDASLVCRNGFRWRVG